MRQMTTSGTLRRPNGGWNFYFYCLCASSERDEAFIISEEIYFAPARTARTALMGVRVERKRRKLWLKMPVRGSIVTSFAHFYPFTAQRLLAFVVTHGYRMDCVMPKIKRRLRRRRLRDVKLCHEKTLSCHESNVIKRLTRFDNCIRNDNPSLLTTRLWNDSVTE